MVSYARHYKDALTEAAGALREAATLTHEATLRKYLTLRAQALLDDDYCLDPRLRYSARSTAPRIA